MKIQLSLARSKDWFAEMTKEQQAEYIKAHPKSKYAKQHARAKPKKDVPKPAVDKENVAVRMNAILTSPPPVLQQSQYNPQAMGSVGRKKMQLAMQHPFVRSLGAKLAGLVDVKKSPIIRHGLSSLTSLANKLRPSASVNLLLSPSLAMAGVFVSLWAVTKGFKLASAYLKSKGFEQSEIEEDQEGEVFSSVDPANSLTTEQLMFMVESRIPDLSKDERLVIAGLAVEPHKERP